MSFDEAFFFVEAFDIFSIQITKFFDENCCCFFVTNPHVKQFYFSSLWSLRFHFEIIIIFFFFSLSFNFHKKKLLPSHFKYFNFLLVSLFPPKYFFFLSVLQNVDNEYFFPISGSRWPRKRFENFFFFSIDCRRSTRFHTELIKIWLKHEKSYEINTFVCDRTFEFLFNAAAAVIFIFLSQGFSGLEFKNVLLVCFFSRIFFFSFFLPSLFFSSLLAEKISAVFNSEEMKRIFPPLSFYISVIDDSKKKSLRACVSEKSFPTQFFLFIC